jgi:hypothetical protein
MLDCERRGQRTWSWLTSQTPHIVNWSTKSYDPAFGQAGPDTSVKGKIISLIASVRMIMRSTCLSRTGSPPTPSLSSPSPGPRPPAVKKDIGSCCAVAHSPPPSRIPAQELTPSPHSTPDHHKHPDNSLRAHPRMRSSTALMLPVLGCYEARCGDKIPAGRGRGTQEVVRRRPRT